jgi:hypothetical protein
MIAIQRESNRALFLIAKAIADSEKGNISPAHREATTDGSRGPYRPLVLYIMGTAICEQ